MSVKWRPRKAGGVIQSKEKGWRTRVGDGVNSSPRTGEDLHPSSSRQAGNKRDEFLFPPTPSTNQMMPDSAGEDNLLSPQTQMLISSRNNHLTDPGVFNVGTSWPVKLTQN